jgi:hypothetical protein
MAGTYLRMRLLGVAPAFQQRACWSVNRFDFIVRSHVSRLYESAFQDEYSAGHSCDYEPVKVKGSAHEATASGDYRRRQRRVLLAADRPKLVA